MEADGLGEGENQLKSSQEAPRALRIWQSKESPLKISAFLAQPSTKHHTPAVLGELKQNVFSENPCSENWGVSQPRCETWETRPEPLKLFLANAAGTTNFNIFADWRDDPRDAGSVRIVLPFELRLGDCDVTNPVKGAGWHRCNKALVAIRQADVMDAITAFVLYVGPHDLRFG